MPKEAKDPQCGKTIDKEYWNSQWLNNRTGWDVGHASPAITTYMDQYANKNAAILIPGCGNAHEAEFLVVNGFTNITLIDIAPKAVSLITAKFADMPHLNILCGDFFEHEGKYDLIIEQTFFCALPPNRRNDYAEKMSTLLNENGRVIGLMFDKFFEKNGPPFGGSKAEYKSIFERYFIIKTIEECYNSILPRVGSEIFINLIKKQK